MKPFAFAPNRVWRVYLGGRGIDLMRGTEPPQDGFFPEDWVASDTLAINPESHGEAEGISRAVIDGNAVRFDELLARRAVELLGADHVAAYGPKLGFLTKILDSAIRLPLQAHPNRETSRRLFQSPYGKTEAWLVLNTRDENSYLMIGFNPQVDEARFRAEAMTGDMPDSLEMVHRHPVKAGDVLIIRGGLVHAIGPGVTLIEIMEPTDWVIQPERFCGDFPIPRAGRFGGETTDAQAMLDVFDFTAETKAGAWERNRLTPRTVSHEHGAHWEVLVDREELRYFGAARLRLSGAWHGALPFGCAAAGIVTAGEVQIGALQLRRGDTFFVPFSAGGLDWQGQAEVVFSLPPALD